MSTVSFTVGDTRVRLYRHAIDAWRHAAGLQFMTRLTHVVGEVKGTGHVSDGFVVVEECSPPDVYDSDGPLDRAVADVLLPLITFHRTVPT